MEVRQSGAPVQAGGAQGDHKSWVILEPELHHPEPWPQVKFLRHHLIWFQSGLGEWCEIWGVRKWGKRLLLVFRRIKSTEVSGKQQLSTGERNEAPEICVTKWITLTLVGQ